MTPRLQRGEQPPPRRPGPGAGLGKKLGCESSGAGAEPGAKAAPPPPRPSSPGLCPYCPSPGSSAARDVCGHAVGHRRGGAREGRPAGRPRRGAPFPNHAPRVRESEAKTAHGDEACARVVPLRSLCQLPLAPLLPPPPLLLPPLSLAPRPPPTPRDHFSAPRKQSTEPLVRRACTAPPSGPGDSQGQSPAPARGRVRSNLERRRGSHPRLQPDLGAL